MSDVGKEKMWECLCHFFKSHSIQVPNNTSDYMKMMNGTEILMLEDYKVIHSPDSNMLGIHFDGSIMPIGIQKLT